MIQATVAGIMAEPKINKNKSANTEMVPPYHMLVTVLTAFTEVSDLIITVTLDKESTVRNPFQK